jgi:hypothetical protein
MKKSFAFLLSALLLFSAPALAAKSKATPTPPPLEITAEPQEPPEQIQRVLDIAWQEWETVNGKDQGVKNKYTTWFNNYNWGKNSWCAGFVTWCMLEAGIPQMPQEDLMKNTEEGTAPEPIFHVKGSAPKKMAPGYLYMHRTSHIPQKGFIVLYGEKSNRYIHVGLVYNVEHQADGTYRLTCIEGAMKNTVRMFVYDYDPNKENIQKNISLVPKEERTEEESKIFTYGNHKKGTSWYVNCFLMPWIPGDENL